MSFSVFVFLCFYLVQGVVSQSQPLTISISLTPSYTPSYTNSYTPSYTNSYTPSYTNSYTPSYTNSYTPSYTTSISGSITFTPRPSILPSQSNFIYTPPFNFKTDVKKKRINQIQCGYKNPNCYCKWLPGSIGYKRVRMEVDCSSTNTLLNTVNIVSYRAVSNTSTPRYTRGTAPGSQQESLVSLDLPPNMQCKLVLTCRMYSNLVKLTGSKTKTWSNTTGVYLTTSKFYFTNKNSPGDTFTTGPVIHLF